MAVPRGPYDELTEREREVITLMARGLTNGQIAERLDIAFETAKWHVAHIISKTGAATREEAVANWSAWNRPGARARRWVRGVGGIPRPLKLGLSAVAIGAIAGTVLLLWLSGSDDDGAISVDEPVQYLLQVGTEREAFLPLPFDEALRRQVKDGGFPSFVPLALPGNRGLRPTDVYVRLPGDELIGFAQFGVSFGNGFETEPEKFSITVEREVFYGPDGPVDHDGSNVHFDHRDWEFTEALSGAFEVAYGRSPRGDITQFIAWRNGSIYLTTLTFFGLDQLTHEEGMAILETVLAQE